MNTTPSTLLRRPAPGTPRAAAPDPHVTITGTLLEDAHTRIEPATGRAAYAITISQAGGRPGVTAIRWVGDGPEAAAHADERARSLRAGDIVTAHGDGVAFRYTHGVLAITLVVTRDVELVTAREERKP